MRGRGSLAIGYRGETAVWPREVNAVGRIVRSAQRRIAADHPARGGDDLLRRRCVDVHGPDELTPLRTGVANLKQGVTKWLLLPGERPLLDHWRNERSGGRVDAAQISSSGSRCRRTWIPKRNGSRHGARQAD